MLSEEEYLISSDISPLQSAVPDATEWEHLCTCLCFDFNRLSSTRVLYCNEWRISLCPTVYVVFLIISSLITYFVFVAPNIAFRNFWIDFTLTATDALFLISYLVAIFEGPGFLPYYYPFQITKRNDGLTDYLSGVVSNAEQEEFVKRQPKFKRCKYFATVRRYVLRPDHFCGWTQQFMGKKNYKLFILFNIYGAIYLTLFTAFSLIAIINLMSQREPNLLAIVFLIIFLMHAVLFTFMTWGFACSGLFNTHMNTTQFEQMTHTKTKPRENCIDNWEEVCGSHKKWYLWPFPVPPFHGVPPEYLLTHTV